MYLYRATKDPFLINIGEDALRSIELSTKTECGYATVKNVRDHTLENRMESFFLSETTKYLYLLFDEDNFIHNPGSKAEVITTEHGTCVIDAGGYIFNTEAHPVDPAALNCCSGLTMQEVKDHIASHMLNILNPEHFNEFKGDLIPNRIKQIEVEREEEELNRRERLAEYLKQMEQVRAKEREAIKRKLELEELRKKRQEKLNEELEESEDAQVDVKAAQDQNDIKTVGSIEEEVTGQGTVELISPAVQAEQTMEAKDDSSDLPFSGSVEKVDIPTEDESVMIKRQSKDETIEEPFKGSQDEKPTSSSEMGMAMEMVEALSNLVNKILVNYTDNVKYDPELFRLRVLEANEFKINPDWYSDHGIMSCAARSFLERFSIQGDFFEEY